jgi:hypothetical protein
MSDFRNPRWDPRVARYRDMGRREDMDEGSDETTPSLLAELGLSRPRDADPDRRRGALAHDARNDAWAGAGAHSQLDAHGARGQPHGPWRDESQPTSYGQRPGAPYRFADPDAEPWVPQRKPVGPKGYQRSDDRILDDLCQRLAHGYRLDLRDVSVAVEDGTVTLTGSVGDRQQKYRLEDISEDTFGVKEVRNLVRVSRVV